MKKIFKNYLIVWALLLAVFNLVTFVSPAETEQYYKFGGAFWGGYFGITAAFLGQLLITWFATRADTLQKFFYNVPLIRISRAGLVLTLIAGVLCMVIPDFPNWLAIVLCFGILALNFISVTKAQAAAELVSESDDRIKAKTGFVRALTAEAQTLLSNAASPSAKAACKKVYEALRYSDPMSDEAFVPEEEQIAAQFAVLSAAVRAADDTAVTAAAEELVQLVDARNAKCKAYK